MLTSLMMISRTSLATRSLRLCAHCRRLYATAPHTPPAPPLLLKLRGDMKDAMKSGDKNRLNVLKTLISEVTNASKTASPIKTDMQLLGLLRKRAASAKMASTEAGNAGRQDLKEKGDQEVAVLEEYAGGVQTMGAEDMQMAVTEVVERLKGESGNVNQGDVLKRLLAPGGSLDGMPVEKAEVAKLVKQLLAR